MDRPRALYVHVPFCPQICPYCDFHKMRRGGGLVARYVERLEAEIAAAGARYPGPLDTIYLGGGTPSHLRDDELERVVAALDAAWGMPARRETTIEADPGTFDPDRLARLRAWGFDRLSIGVQSTQDAALRFLGRSHDGAAAERAVGWALEAGFAVSADLIAALPASVPRDLEADIDRLVALGVPHVSVYTLTIEPFTPFALRGVSVDDDRAADAYDATASRLAAHGLERYEVSNHARPGHEAIHNASYWHGAPYLGLGPSAAGYLPGGRSSATGGDLGRRTTNPPIKTWLEGAPPDIERPDADTYLRERLMTGLRTRRGVDLDALARTAGVDVRDRWSGPLASALDRDLLELEGATLRATERGLVRLDAVLRPFFAS